MWGQNRRQDGERKPTGRGTWGGLQGYLAINTWDDLTGVRRVPCGMGERKGPMSLLSRR